MKNKLLLTKQRSLRAKKLTEKRAEQTRLNSRSAELDRQLEAVTDEIPADLETQINQVAEDLAAVESEISTLEGEISDLDNEIAQIEDEIGGGSANPSNERGRAPPAAVAGINFRSRSRCFSDRAQRDAFYARSSVKSFLQRVRTLGQVANRSITGADLPIPTDILDLLRDNLHQYSKLITKVRLRAVSGHARQNVIGKVPEGIWMEMAGALNNLTFKITDVETDGFKVGGYIPVDNYILKDSDVALGEEIMYMLGQSIGYALDKAIVFGLGRSSKMPVGIVTRLAQTNKPDYWGENQGDWTDLHSANVLKLNLAAVDGVSFFVPFLSACAKAKPTFSTDGKIWIMNDLTRQDLQIRALAFNSNAALMAGMENTMPVVGGEIITLEFMPDHMIVGGYGGEYLLVEREGGSFGSSDHVFYIQDKTVFKGTARYDGQPIAGEAFVAMTYDNTEVLTKMDFKPDYANTAANALVVTSASGGAGMTKLTVAGTVSGSHKLMAIVGAPAAIAKGDKPGKGWTEIKSDTTTLAATTGMGATVVELDEDGLVISIGYCANVTAG